MLIINFDAVKKALPMAEAIEAMKQALIAISTQAAVIPQRHHISPPTQTQNTMLIMPAIIPVPHQPAFTVKIASVCPENVKRELPQVESTVLAFDAKTGRLMGMLDGKAITSIRTAATSAVATRLLANPHCKTLAILGTGIQARAHIQAMCEVLSPQKIIIWGRDPKKVKKLLEETRHELGKQTELGAENCPDAAVKHAQVVCTTTSSSHPLFKAESIAPGTHINAIGAYRPTMSEIPLSLVGQAKVYVESRRSALMEAGEIVQAIDAGILTENQLAGEIGELHSNLQLGRRTADEITLFKSVGNAAEDAYAAQLAVQNAIEQGLGYELELD